MASRIPPPFSPPDCPWKAMGPGSELPESAVEFGKLKGDTVYIGRVFDGDCYLNGTALPSKGFCLYLSKKLEVKKTDTYDILTVDCGNPLEFQPKALDSNLLFVSGGDEDRCLYTARVIDGEDTYIGWADQDTKDVYVPKEPANRSPDKYDILIHRFLDRLCICPVPPTSPPL